MSAYTAEQLADIWHGRNLLALHLSAAGAEVIRADMAAIIEGAPPGAMPLNANGDPAHEGVWEALAEQLAGPPEFLPITPQVRQVDYVAVDPATDAAHEQLSAWEDLPDSAGVITPMHMLVRAQVLAQIGTSNQVAGLIQALHDLREGTGRELSELRSTLARHGGFE